MSMFGPHYCTEDCTSRKVHRSDLKDYRMDMNVMKLQWGTPLYKALTIAYFILCFTEPAFYIICCISGPSHHSNIGRPMR